MSIGRTLTQAREHAGLSVGEVADATRIRRTLIYAIECDDFSGCGGDFYARGHIRTIAHTVGTDPKPLHDVFEARHRTAVPPRATEVFESETAARPERRGPNWSAAMAAALVLVLAYGVFQAVTGGEQQGPTAGLESPSAGVTEQETEEQASEQPNGSDAVAQAPRDRVTVVLRATDRSWVQATTASGKELFQGLLERGQVKTFTDRQRVRLVVGNAGAVRMTVNGTNVGTPGRPGQVARVQFGPEDPAAG
ncbi:MAG: helix-turn-helix domain-containing protein [Propionibacteriales bacterium]|nr:helix-turn-helix domain-containing protein [Propionibacteriales bacterium]